MAGRSANRLGAPARIVAVYALLVSVWIGVSDVASAVVLNADSAYVWLQILSGLVFVAVTSALLYVLIRRDIQRINRSMARLRAVLESMADAVLVVDRHRNIVEANAAAGALFGCERKEQLLGSVEELVSTKRLHHPDGRPLWMEERVTSRVLEGETLRGLELMMTMDSGDPIWLSLNGSPVFSRDGQVELAVVVIRDITALKHLERMRDEFLASAAHELRSPIASIKGYSQLLERWAPGGHEPREGTAFRVLNRQCDRLGRLVDDLLEISRLELGRLQLRRQRFDLRELVEDAEERMRGISVNHELTLTDAPLPAEVEADRDRIDEVLVNLLDNAIKFSPPGTEIHTDVTVLPDQVVVSVRDSGIGIPADRQEKLFQRYYRAHAGLANDRGGMGIGLYLSKEIVERHGGRIWFESREGAGSTFYFCLPLAPPAYAEAPQPMA
ncbi:MAG: ATP-binding protein [Myxococcaceae bacterium]